MFLPLFYTTFLHVKSLNDILFLINNHERESVVNWNGHLEPYTTYVRFGIKVFTLQIWWRLQHCYLFHRSPNPFQGTLKRILLFTTQVLLTFPWRHFTFLLHWYPYLSQGRYSTNETNKDDDPGEKKTSTQLPVDPAHVLHSPGHL